MADTQKSPQPQQRIQIEQIKDLPGHWRVEGCPECPPVEITDCHITLAWNLSPAQQHNTHANGEVDNDTQRL